MCLEMQPSNRPLNVSGRFIRPLLIALVIVVLVMAITTQSVGLLVIAISSICFFSIWARTRSIKKNARPYFSGHVSDWSLWEFVIAFMILWVMLAPIGMILNPTLHW